MSNRSVLLVLAGVNGAGKSSIGGGLLEQRGLSWFNPDSFARDIRAMTNLDLATAQEMAWQEGIRRLDRAIGEGRSHAFETTLGGATIRQRLWDATQTHDLLVWFCGLASAEQHEARVALRVRHGGHDIPVDRIRERYRKAPLNLISLLPRISHLKVYDNSHDVGAGEPLPEPCLVLESIRHEIAWPRDIATLAQTPAWAKPIVQAALETYRSPWA